MIGCGNSEISGDMHSSGYNTITNIDFSPLVIEEMISKNTHRCFEGTMCEWCVRVVATLNRI